MQDVPVEIPKRRLTVLTGVSGSGKSSLVFDTIAAEPQRLYPGANPGPGIESALVDIFGASSTWRSQGVLASGSVAQAARDAALGVRASR